MDIQQSISLAYEDVAATQQILRSAGQSWFVAPYKTLADLLLPNLVQSHPISPVHHATGVGFRMAEIMRGEGVTSREEWKRGLPAALAHDLGLGATGEGRKIRKAEFERLADDKRLAEIEAAVQSRVSHSDFGAAFIPFVLVAANGIHRETFDPEDIGEIARLIQNHDNVSIAEYETLRGGSPGRWLSDPKDLLMKWLREADRSWMVTVRGVTDADLIRDALENTRPNRLRRLSSNIRRHHEEAELYRQHLQESAFKSFGFREGTLYRSKTGHEIFRREISAFFEGRVSVAASLGGTKVRVGLVDEAGGVLETTPPLDWRAAFGIRDDDATKSNASKSDALTNGIADLMRHAAGLLPAGRVERYGLATKGPLERRGRELLLRPDGPMPNMPYDRYPIEEKLRSILGSSSIVVLHDGAAAALGEASPSGTLTGATDFSVVIIGTGVGLGVVSGGLIYDGNPSDPYENKLGSLGRHLVYCPALDGDFRYKYDPIGSGASQAVIVGEEQYLTDRIAGRYLFRRLAGLLLDRQRVSDRTYFDFLRDMGDGEDIGMDRMKLERALPAGITNAALHGNEWARGQIIAMGRELGVALSALIRQFSDREFLDKIALVSTVGEKFGAGVRGESSDLFIETVNGVLGGQRVVRSQYFDRELAAFSRWPI